MMRKLRTEYIYLLQYGIRIIISILLYSYNFHGQQSRSTNYVNVNNKTITSDENIRIIKRRRIRPIVIVISDDSDD